MVSYLLIVWLFVELFVVIFEVVDLLLDMVNLVCICKGFVYSIDVVLRCYRDVYVKFWYIFDCNLYIIIIFVCCFVLWCDFLVARYFCFFDVWGVCLLWSEWWYFDVDEYGVKLVSEEVYVDCFILREVE